ncbi:MAG TPA: hypothetical protein VE201_05370 [Nitrospirales bacterium]|jgi:hypothetical protein|nr:hypothetical protein [Nitrospirales bacterium]
MSQPDINVALIGTTILLAIGIFGVDFFYPLGVAVGALYTPLVLITLWSSYRHFTLIVTVGASILTVVGLFYPLYGAADQLAVTNRVLSLITIWVAAILVLLYKRAEEERVVLVRQLQDALANIKTLHGLLPICSSCKKIRDDHGYWNQLEIYIGTHTDAEFTHGLCPECIQKLYPDYSQSKRADRSDQ